MMPPCVKCGDARPKIQRHTSPMGIVCTNIRACNTRARKAKQRADAIAADVAYLAHCNRGA